MSQEDLARALRQAGSRVGCPNDASKRLVQRWESGTIAAPRPVYARALETVTGRPIEALGFTILGPLAQAGETGNVPTGEPPPIRTTSPVHEAKTAPAAYGTYSGVWLSRYRYPSSGRGAELTGQHYVVVLQHGSRLTIRSLPNGSSNPNSPLTMDLEVSDHVVTGTWTEETAPDGYYRGAVYHGAIQMLVEPTGRKMAGMWVGFGKDFEVNTGPWELVFQTADTSRQSLAEYDKSPQEDRETRARS